MELLAKLRTRKEKGIRTICLDASKADQIAQTLREPDKSIDIGKVSTIQLKGYSVNVLPKLMVGELKRLELVAGEESHVSDTLNTGNGSIDIWGIKDLELHDYAVNVLPKLKIGENKEMESFVLRKKEEVSMANIISMEDESIEIGRIKRKGFDVPEEIKPKLKYILIDKTEREIMEERAREIAKERKRKIMEERTREIANEKTREIAKEEKTKKGSFPSRVLKKILGRGRS